MPIKFISATPAGLASSSLSVRAGIDRRKSLLRAAAVLAGLSLLVLAAASPTHSYAHEQTSAGTPHRDPLSEREMEVLVARIALYPDELVAAIAAASLYPLQIVEAERYMERFKTKPELKPDKDWDGSVISLMNYPEIVKMMSDDLEWTQHLGEAVAYQQKDMLEAIQQLRERAVANGIIKSDDKTVVVVEREKVIIKSARADKVYIPVYRSEDLYDSSYASKRVSYYSDSYSSYYDPTATYYAAYVTGVAWAAAVDWYEGETWSGYGRWGKDVEINCDDCFNDRTFNGDISLNQVDWTKVDSSRVTFDKSQLTRLDHNTLSRDLKADGNNSLAKRAADLNPHRLETPPDSRQIMNGESLLKGLKNAAPSNRLGEIGRARSGLAKPFAGKPGMAGAKSKPHAGGRANPLAGKPKPGARIGARPRHPAPKRDIMRGRGPRAFSHDPRRRDQTRGGKPQFKRPIRGGGGLTGPPRPNVPSGGPSMQPFGGPPRL
ncbi:DUF3300 domain-containing protein [Mesorhizobium onobrychidis]|uniref:DUF3300 domain-containing protein n=1 Tax=Mesorhizobium onobrychidis TaxID=2775404 RepID=A0ABY5R350_9HYPH|nr:DUF3300 domain-containing protein [Mesorhizobium onobrychidis]UVC17911.1 DUF3300 domain-containing protein [Mesorhizobium onobrychidis]